MTAYKVLAVAMVAGLGGCATVPADSDGEAARISYATGPCFGACPVFELTVASDGAGTFNGKRFTAAAGERAFAATPAQFAAFAEALAPYRPESGEVRYERGSPLCPRAATDQTSVNVTWTEADGDTQSLYYYFGCNMEDRSMGIALRNAADRLPVTDMIGARR
jgi:hypothetical protein